MIDNSKLSVVNLYGNDMIAGFSPCDKKKGVNTIIRHGADSRECVEGSPCPCLFWDVSGLEI